MLTTQLSILEDLARLDLAERLAEGEKMRLARIARKAAPKGRPLRATVADALRALATRLDRDVSIPAHADRRLARVS